MAVYAIILREEPIAKPEEREAYLRILAASRRETPCRVLAHYGELTGLEGEPPDGAAILEFATMQDARDWHDNPDYQRASVHRRASAHHRVILIEGI